MFRRDVLLAVEQTLFTPQARLVGGLACIKLSKNGKGYDGMLNCLFEVVKNTVVNAMLNKPSMEDVRIKMEKKTRKETVEVKEEEKQEVVEETVEVKEEQKQEVVEETVEVKEEQKVEEVKEEKVDEIDVLLTYVQEYENEKIMNESLEDLLNDKELAEKYNVDELFDDYDYVDEYDYVDCSKEAVHLNHIFEEDEVIKATNVEVVEEEKTVDDILEENRQTLDWLEKVMDISGCSAEELFRKCEENREEINK